MDTPDDPARTAGFDELDHERPERPEREYDKDEPYISTDQPYRSDAGANTVARIVTSMPIEPTSGDWLLALTRAYAAGDAAGFARGFSMGQSTVTATLDFVTRAMGR